MLVIPIVSKDRKEDAVFIIIDKSKCKHEHPVIANLRDHTAGVKHGLIDPNIVICWEDFNDKEFQTVINSGKAILILDYLQRKLPD